VKEKKSERVEVAEFKNHNTMWNIKRERTKNTVTYPFLPACLFSNSYFPAGD